jgi:hypothetical protein
MVYPEQNTKWYDRWGQTQHSLYADMVQHWFCKPADSVRVTDGDLSLCRSMEGHFPSKEIIIVRVYSGSLLLLGGGNWQTYQTFSLAVIHRKHVRYILI